MGRAPVGALVSLYYDSPRPVAEGDFLQTPTKRTYRVEGVRTQTRGKWVGRKHISAVVVEPEEAEGGVVHPLVWYMRGKSKRPPRARAVFKEG